MSAAREAGADLLGTCTGANTRVLGEVQVACWSGAGAGASLSGASRDLVEEPP